LLYIISSQGLLYDKILQEWGSSSLVGVFQAILKTIMTDDLSLWFILTRGLKDAKLSDACKCPILQGRSKDRIKMDSGIYKHIINKPLYRKSKH